ncbi:hypothetical protein Cgig2_017512 [Carnegiea gigantea]|uniref:Uncharacterized protein n=1 Tax=Carnegiea gigantea TaxID=171969 RepID=A0A9Q1K3Y8_9CARY|nr:hypothetical protein Cgig2_017512 [Carnegiea gigantea]
MKSTFMAPKNQAHTEPSVSTHGSSPAHKEPSVACGRTSNKLSSQEIDTKNDGFLMYCTTDVVKQRNKDEKEFPGEHGKGRTINREEYQKIIHERDIKLQTKLTHVALENQVHTKPSASTHGFTPTPKEPSLACGSERGPPIVGTNDPIEERDAKTNSFQQQHIRQLMQLNKETKIKRSFRESMEGVRQSTRKNIRRLFTKVKLNYKRSRRIWHQKAKRIQNLRHQPHAFLLTPKEPSLACGRTTKVGKMVEKTLERGDHGEEFQRDFMLHIISTCIIWGMNSDSMCRILKSVRDADQTLDYNWHPCLLQCLNDGRKEMQRPMVSSSNTLDN